MILLSNIIKSATYTPVSDKKIIEASEVVNRLSSHKNKSTHHSEGVSDEDVMKNAEREAEELKQQIVQDAEEMAENILEQARKKANQLTEDAKQQIAAWWEENRNKDKEAFEEAANQGFQQGLEEGKLEAEKQVKEQYEADLKQAKSILLIAQEQKETIIQQAEPFLVELATAIAEKIIGKQLTLESGWMTELAKTVLARRKEQGTITLCVSPTYYTQMLDAREELLRAVDSQAELTIVPDSTVQDHGCVVRSSYGSIDARIDTQLAEIKSALLEVTTRSEERKST